MEEGLVYATWTLIELTLLFTGRGIVRVASLGRWRSEHLNSNEGRVHSPAGALSFKRDGQRVITESGLLIIGLAFYAVVAATVLMFAVS